MSEHPAIRTPVCPKCGGPPLLPGVLPYFCRNSQCDVLSWDATKTREELLTDPSVWFKAGEPPDPVDWPEAKPEDLNEGAVLLGRPVEIPLAVKQAMEKEVGVPYKPTNAVEAPCEACGKATYLGPRQAQYIGKPGFHVGCMLCAAASGLKADAPNLKHLGGEP